MGAPHEPTYRTATVRPERRVPTQVKSTRPGGRAPPLWLAPPTADRNRRTARSAPSSAGPAARPLGDGPPVQTTPYDRPCQQITTQSPGDAFRYGGDDQPWDFHRPSGRAEATETRPVARRPQVILRFH